MRSRERSWASRIRETTAFLSQARLLPFDLADSHRGEGDLAVVLVHGLYATAGVFRPLRTRLEQELGCSTHTFSYRPGPGIGELGERLTGLLRRLDRPSCIALVGHSLGGLVVCHVAGQPDLDPRVLRTVTLAAPFRGSRRHSLVPGQAGRDVALGAPVLAKLSSGKGRPRALPHLSILGGEDTMIEPDAYPEFGQLLRIPLTGHNGILFHPDTMDAVACFLRPGIDQPAGVARGWTRETGPLG